MFDRNEVIDFLTNIHVLYVEDNQDTREATHCLFEEFFHHIIVATDGQDGYNKFKENKVDLIITDINMPKLNGIDMIKKIREIDVDIPILILSAYNESGYFTESIKAGVDGYLLKPIDINQFLSVLNKVTKKIKLANDLQAALSISLQYQDATDKSSIVSKTDLKGKITYVNEEFCQISGYSKEELLGKNHNIIRHPDNPKEIYEHLWNVISKKQTWKGVIRNISKDRKSYYVKTTIKAIVDLNGDIIEYIALRDDITDIMSSSKQLEYFIKYSKKPMLSIMEIVDYKNLRKFYGQLKIIDIEEKIGIKLFELISGMCECQFEKIYILGEGKFAIAKDNMNLPIEQIANNLKEFLTHINSTHLTIDDSTYDISLRMALSQGKNVLENCIYAMEEMSFLNQDFIIANDLAEVEQEKAKINLNTLKMVSTAINHKKIISYFQPIIDNKTQEVVKYESLVRLINEKEEVLAPYFFLDTAKDGRFYSQITRIVLLNSFHALYLTDKSISINLSALDIEQESVRDFIFELLEEHKEHSHRIVFELLEDENIKDIQLIKTFIKRVKEYSVLIAIDDFGAGYSNFERLLEYEPDILKIDASLIKNILTNQYSLNVVKTIITFAKSQNIQIIAEYVENEEIYKLLNDLDVDFSQGYYFGKPEHLKI